MTLWSCSRRLEQIELIRYLDLLDNHDQPEQRDWISHVSTSLCGKIEQSSQIFANKKIRLIVFTACDILSNICQKRNANVYIIF